MGTRQLWARRADFPFSSSFNYVQSAGREAANQEESFNCQRQDRPNSKGFSKTGHTHTQTHTRPHTQKKTTPTTMFGLFCFQRTQNGAPQKTRASKRPALLLLPLACCWRALAPPAVSAGLVSRHRPSSEERPFEGGGGGKKCRGGTRSSSHHFETRETIVCWYLQGNHHSRVS